MIALDHRPPTIEPTGTLSSAGQHDKFVAQVEQPQHFQKRPRVAEDDAVRARGLSVDPDPITLLAASSRQDCPATVSTTSPPTVFGDRYAEIYDGCTRRGL